MDGFLTDLGRAGAELLLVCWANLGEAGEGAEGLASTVVFVVLAVGGFE